MITSWDSYSTEYTWLHAAVMYHKAIYYSQLKQYIVVNSNYIIIRATNHYGYTFL